MNKNKKQLRTAFKYVGITRNKNNNKKNEERPFANSSSSWKPIQKKFRRVQST